MLGLINIESTCLNSKGKADDGRQREVFLRVAKFDFEKLLLALILKGLACGFFGLMEHCDLVVGYC